MKRLPRILDLTTLAAKKSCFLFGPRQTGKTSLLRHCFPDAPTYNLLQAELFLQLSQRPQLLREQLLEDPRVTRQPVVIDEVQKLPILLDEVHDLIEQYGWRFVLTGSSARKLRRSGANLLGGRARTYPLLPLVSVEIPKFNLVQACNIGTLPSMYFSDDPWTDLQAYVGNYLQEEIQAESAVRRIEYFSRFLRVAALANGELINFTNVGNDAGVPPRTITEYFAILQDTLIGVLLEPFRRTTQRKAISTAKFYFFDVGVANCLADRRHIRPSSELFGNALEHFLFTELRAALAYRQDTRPLTYWRSTAQHEVDFLLGDDVGIEVKATTMATDRHARGLRALTEELPLKRQIIVSRDTAPRRLGKIEILPVGHFLEELWATGFR